MQEVRWALRVIRTGTRVHATYTHVELPVKRLAIRQTGRMGGKPIQNLGDTMTVAKKKETTPTTSAPPGSLNPDRSRNHGRRKTPVQIILDQVDKLRGRARVMKKYCSRRKSS